MDYGDQTPAHELRSLWAAERRGCPSGSIRDVWELCGPGECSRFSARGTNPSPLDDERRGIQGENDCDQVRSGGRGIGRCATAQPARIATEVSGRWHGSRHTVTAVLRRWNCANCGRSNRTAVTVAGTAECEYCTTSMRIQPLQPWGPRLFRFAARLMSLGSRKPGCLHWRPVRVESTVWRGPGHGR